MNIAKRLLSVARPYAGRLLLVAVLTSLGALGELVEPWVYRAIINDIAGVFVSKATGLWPEILEELRSGGGEADVETPPAPATPPPSGPSTTTAPPVGQAPSAATGSEPAGAPKPAAAFAAAGRTKPPTGPPADRSAVLSRSRSPAANRLPRDAHPVVGSARAAGRYAAR